MRYLYIIATIGLILFIPLLLIPTNLKILVGGVGFYEYGFNKYNITEVTGLEDKELTKAAEGLIRYFNADTDSPQVQVTKEGQQMDIFNQKELDHLVDVKDIIRLFYTAGWIALGYAVLYLVVGFMTRRLQFIETVAKVCFGGGILTLSLIGIIGVWALIDFDRLFINFHLLSFANDLWLLDPAKDYLIMLFPEGFFLDAAMFLVITAIIEALILAGGAWFYLRRRKQRDVQLLEN
jgi:integral membrane protein (TIGR01906 family)